MNLNLSEGVAARKDATGNPRASNGAVSHALVHDHIEMFGAWEIDLSSEPPSPDRALERMLQFCAPATLNAPDEVFERLHPEDADSFRKTFERALEKTQGCSCEFRWLTRSGSVRWLSSQAKVLSDEFGRPLKMIGVARDITDFKKAELRSQAFAQLGQKLSAATTPREAAEIIGQVAQTLFGWDCYYLHFFLPENNRILPVINIDTVNGQKVEVPVTSSEPSPMLKKVLRDGATMILRNNETELLADLVRFGDTQRASLSLMFVPIRNLKRLLGILSIQSYSRHAYSATDLEVFQALADHTGGALDRIYLEQQQRARDHRFSSLFEHSMDGIALADQAGKIHFANPATYQLLEIKSDHAKNLFLCCHRDDLPDLQEKWQNLISSRKIVAQFRTRSDAPAPRIIELTGTYIPELLGDNAIVLNLRDITQQLDLEAQLRQAQKLESVGQLAAGVAHEFNNVLTIIQGYTGLLLRNGGLSENAREQLGFVASGAERATRLTRHLLAFSRKQPMQTRAVSLGDLVQTSLRLLKQVLGEQIEVELSLPRGGDKICADPAMVEQVIVNLAVNARDAMANGGLLKFEVFLREVPVDAGDRHPEASPGSFVCLRVSDQGCGMSPEVLSRIFEPFFTTKEPGKGSGLGLSTVYGVVKQHKGWIEVTSKPGAGTSFLIHWPAGASPDPALTSPELPLPIQGKQETILVVEDEEALRFLVREILKDFGYNVLVASNGQEALALWDQHSSEIDLLFTDLVMPGGLSGFDVARELRSRKPDLRVLCTSGYSDELPQNKDSPNLTFLPKPYHPFTLGKVLRDVLDK